MQAILKDTIHCRSTGMIRAALLVFLAITACGSTGGETGMPGPAPTRALETRTTTPVPATPIETKRPTTPSPTFPPPPTATQTATHAAELRVPSWRGKLIHDGNNGEVVMAYWSEDGNVLNYGIVHRVDQAPDFSWFAYDLTTQAITPVTTFYDQLEEILRMQNLLERPGSIRYPIFDGIISPSGNRLIYAVRYGEDCFSDQTYTQIRIYDPRASKTLYSYDLGYCRVLPQAFWFDQEKKVIYDICYEGPCGLTVYDGDTNELELLENLIGEQVATDAEWSVDPLGNTAVLLNYYREYRIDVIDLHTWSIRHVNDFGIRFSWSPDGRTLYYWGGEDYMDAFDSTEIRALDIQTGEIHPFMDRTQILEASIDLPMHPKMDATSDKKFTVSANEDQIALWDGWGRLWIFEKFE